MTMREQVLAALNGEPVDVIPTIGEAFMDVTVAEKLGTPITGDWFTDCTARAQLLKKCDTEVGVGLAARTIEKDADHHLYEYEGGARWLEQYTPTFCREAVQYPVNAPEDAAKFVLPDFHDPARYCGMTELVERFRAAGYFVQGCTGGIWSGAYYFCTGFDKILEWMATEPEAAHEIFTKVGTYVLAAADEMLQRGVDSIFIYDDLGSGQSLLFSKTMYREFIKPWHTKLADLCHRYGKVFHLHSHGHIQDLMDELVEAGVDILNPVGPSDHNDLAMFVERWGDRLVLLGGISTKIAAMSEAEIETHIGEVMAIGRRSPRFMPRTESGIPKMDPAKAKFFIDTLHGYRQRYGQGG